MNENATSSTVDAVALVREYLAMLTEDQRPDEEWAEYAFRRMRAQGVAEVAAYLDTAIRNHERGPDPWDVPVPAAVEKAASSEVTTVVEHYTRCYQTLIEVWSAGVVHPKPTIDLHLEEHGITVYIADDYEHLEAMLIRLLEKVRERRDADGCPPVENAGSGEEQARA